MRLAIFGGSFDPPHVGHLLSAEDAREQLRLDRVVFVPTGTQPLKVGRAAATPQQRLALVRALVDGIPGLEVSALEIERPGLSFTVDTLRHFAAEFAAAERFLLLGADTIPTFAQWREPETIATLARPVVFARNDAPPPPATLGGVAPVCLATRRIDVSSTEIRDRVKAGQSIRGFVPDAVRSIIEREGLYR